ncbi:hypothetical protein Taro_005122 [Colocasia esculenta]|uniref:1-phosphatidylinositol-3-phosphate 5-kinase n=1 Tax=Colocasia esculenta TaxID=4460 RepID=A0A843TK17_COLES|nr:hypothetical protein [Colocasia esculenta]
MEKGPTRQLSLAKRYRAHQQAPSEQLQKAFRTGTVNLLRGTAPNITEQRVRSPMWVTCSESIPKRAPRRLSGFQRAVVTVFVLTSNRLPSLIPVEARLAQVQTGSHHHNPYYKPISAAHSRRLRANSSSESPPPQPGTEVAACFGFGLTLHAWFFLASEKWFIYVLNVDLALGITVLKHRSLEKYVKPFLKMDGLSPYGTPIISPSLSLTSYGSCVSSCGDFQADMNLDSREEGGEVPYSGHDRLNVELIQHLNVQEDKVFQKSNGIRSFDSNCNEVDLGIPTEYTPSILQNDVNGNGEKLSSYDAEVLLNGRVSYGSDRKQNVVDTADQSFLANIERNPLIWLPPEPEDIEDDIECSVANNDDDDEYSDGTKWAQPSFLGSFGGENGMSNRYREERQKAMMEAMNGQFKFLVSRFLASEGIAFSTGEPGESWLDIVSSLSWEAAMLVKPDANEGKAMDPGFYVKIKCIASGSPSQSEVVKGLVFKKNTAHKHMPTRVRNPRLLLLQGVLGQNALGLSSFDSMEQEKDYLKSAIEMIDACQPNVVLVEKTVSRDIQESLLAKGVTLVFDMKLHRLERIARCTGSPIISSSEIPVNPKLKQCDFFHIEKFAEEHNSLSEGGKKPSKTLMFFEGCPKPLGCTILLKGAHSDELKRVKRVVHYTVFAAYHLILETSFFADQRAIFSDMHNSEKYISKKGVNAVSDLGVPSVGIAPPCVIDIPISDGSLKKSSHGGDFFISYIDKEATSRISGFPGFDSNHDPRKNDLMPGGLSNGQICVSGDIQEEKKCEAPDLSQFPGGILSSLSASDGKAEDNLALGSGFYESEISHLSLKLKEPDNQKGEELQSSPSPGPFDYEVEIRQNVDQGNSGGLPVHEKTEQELNLGEHQNAEARRQSEVLDKDDIENVLDPQSILVLLSSQCKFKRTVCEESHLSRIKYYGNFDVSLGRFLQDVLLNKRHICSVCNEPPEAHAYCYTHQSGRLTVLVKRLPPESHLSGEGEGKIWMWTRCLKCEREHGVPRSSRRVLMSNAARGLSFGKFLELSFSGHSAARRISRCGHMLQRDCLRFFGLGSSVAMFIYSSVDIYTACKPPPVLEFNGLSGDGCLKREARELVQTVPEMLGLPFLNQELLLALYVWDQRIHSLLSSDTDDIHGKIQDVSLPEKKDGINESLISEKDKKDAGTIGISTQMIPIDIEEFSFHGSHLSIDITSDEISMGMNGRANNSLNSEMSTSPDMGNLIEGAAGVSSGEDVAFALDVDIHTIPSPVSSPLSYNKDGVVLYHPMQEGSEIASLSGNLGHANSVLNLDTQIDETNGSEIFDKTERYEFTDHHPRAHVLPYSSQLGDPHNWMWNTSEIRKAYRNDLSEGYFQKFEFIQHYTPLHLSLKHQSISQDKEWLHFSVGVDGSIMSVSEDEISSFIAYALARDHYNMDKEAVKDKEYSGTSNLRSDGSVASSYWSSTGSFDLEGLRSMPSLSSFSSDELSTSGFESYPSVDHLMSSEDQHRQIHIGVGKAAGSSKCTVICIYAKEFYALRRRCCPSESAYLSSISRCKKWDAQGGKSKAFFAKTLDDRFIIKQIKKTELDSFLKFAPDYFQHISLSLSSGSQTCLAKILGIYQVKQTKNGKEVKSDLMVMENLLYGRDVSRIYDLKGAVYSRYVSDPTKHNTVLLDQNFVEDMNLYPMYVGGKTKLLLQRAIWNDTSFLTSINVMDYSLLVGVDKQRRELVFGIIDYLRQYTWDKQLETWVKSSLVVPKNALPTVISPKEYKKRFRKFMAKYFLTVPDGWSSEPCSAPCKFCCNGSSNPSQLHCEALPDKSDHPLPKLMGDKV